MPIYEFRTPSGEVIEHICKVSEKPPYLVNPRTGEKAMPIISGIAYTPNAWGVDWKRGMSGGGSYDRGLGMVIYDEKHRTAELEKRGWVRESEVGALTVERANAKYQAKAERDIARSKEFAELNQKHGVDLNNLHNLTPDDLKATEQVWNEWCPPGGDWMED